MIKRILLCALALIGADVYAQGFAVVRPIESVASLTSGNEFGYFSDAFNADSNPVGRNYLYADIPSDWGAGNIPDVLENLPMIHTRDADKASEGATTVVSFDVGSEPVQVIVFHADSEETKPAWLTSGYVDCGLDVFIDEFHSGYSAITSGTVELGGNCPTGGCSGTPNMYVVAVAPTWRNVCAAAVSGEEPPPSDPGTVEFEFGSYAGTEETNVTFHVERNEGCDGAASVSIAESANPGNGTLNTTSVSWVDGDCAKKAGTVTLADVSGNQTMTLDLSSPSGADLGTQTSTLINIIDDDTSPSAQEYWVSCSGTGNGLSAGSPAPPSFAQTISHPGDPGHVIVNWSGSCRNFTYNPAFSGLSATQMIKHCSDGTALWRGPSSGTMGSFFEIDEDWIDLGSDCGDGRIEMDGECVPNASGAATGCHVQTIGRFDGNDNNVGAYIHNTQGWVGLVITGTRNSLRGARIDIHGTPRLNGQDHGDVVNFSTSVPSTHLFGIVDAFISRVGHNPVDIADGSALISGNVIWNRWSGLPGGFTNEGNRTGTIRRLQERTVLENNVLRTNGIPADTSHPPIQSLDGKNALARWNFVIDSEDECFQLVAQNSYRDSVGQRIAHNLFLDCEGPAIWAWHYEGDWEWGDLYIYNNIFVDVAWQARAGSENAAITFNCGANEDITDWRNEFFVRNNIFFGDGSSQYITINGCPGPSAGRRTITEYESLYPGNFSGNIVANPLWVSENKAPTTITGARTVFATQSESPARDAARALTTSNNSGSSQTVVSLVDAGWYTDGKGFGVPTTGPDAGGYKIRNITRGWTATITDVDYSANDVTITPAQTWSSGDSFGYVNTDIGPVDTN